MKERKKVFQVSPREIGTLVTYLDGYAALSVIDPSKIHRLVKKNIEDKDVAAVWKEIERDVFDISALPSSSDEIMRLSKKVEILKPLSMFLPLILLIAYISLEGLGVIRNLGQVGAIGFLVALIAAYIGGFSSYILLTRRLSRKVNQYYKRNETSLARQRRRIKLANQRLIDKLAMNIRSNDRDPEKYKFELLHNDYANIRVVGQDKNNVFTVAVKGKSTRKPS